jgi:hypothetical protein
VEASRNSFLINIITCYILYIATNNKTNKLLALFFLFIGMQQFFDWIFWTHQNITDKNQAEINYVFTKIAMIFNHLQPIILGCLIYYFYGDLKYCSKLVLMLYILVILIYSINIYNEIDYTLIKYKNGRSIPILFWEWNSEKYNEFVYTIFLICASILLYENLDYPKNIICTSVIILSYLFSLYSFKNYAVGRFWCKIAAYIPLLLLIVDKIKKKSCI